jgi:PmbA protein
MIEKLLETAKRKADSAEVFVTETSEIAVNFESGALKSVERKSSYGIGLRIIRDGRIGFSSSTDPDRADDMIENAIACARYGKEVEFEFPGISEKAEPCRVNTFDPAIETFSPETAVREGHRTVEMLKELYPKGMTYTEISSTVSNMRIINTSGLDISYRDTDFSQHVTSVIVDGDSILWIGDGGHFGTLDMRTEEYVRKVADLAVKAETPAPKISGSLPVIFTANEMPTLLKSIEMGVDGRRLLKGDSPLIGKTGETVLGNVTITDNPCIDHAPGSRPFDDEGVSSKTNILFKNGVFQDFLFDLDTASKTGHAPTASAHRGMLTIPGIGSSNMIMSGGSSDLDTMISSINEGIIVYEVLGGGQSNLLAGDFAVNIMLGFLIKGGEIAGRLPDTMLSGNIYNAFGNISSMGSEVKPAGTVFTPDVMFSELPISGR